VPGGTVGDDPVGVKPTRPRIVTTGMVAEVGLANFVVGIIIPWETYSAANPGCGFVVAWGAILGGCPLIRGLLYLDQPIFLLRWTCLIARVYILGVPGLAYDLRGGPVS
jgi:hypothetical protein